MCQICQRPIQGGRPTILLGVEKPLMVGICHSTCGYRWFRYGHFQMRPPDYLSSEQVSFLVQLYFRFYNLPGGREQNGELRLCAVDLVRDFPASLGKPLESLKHVCAERNYWHNRLPYHGDLELDFLRLLSEVFKAAKNNPIGVEFDFRSLPQIKR